MITRRSVASLAPAFCLGGLGITTTSGLALPVRPGQRTATIESRLRALESNAEGRLGVHVLDTATGQHYGNRSDERFMMLSTFKLLASALVLHRVDTGHESLARSIRFAKTDLVDWSPVTGRHADGEGMTLAQLCEATITTSDNTAANLILSSYGGPAAVTAFARQLGDAVTRLDRNEPTVNDKVADAPLLNTTSPRAMAHTMRKLVLGDALSAPSRRRLQQWLLGNTTGDKRLKAGLPSGWRIGDKTGTNRTDTNDIGIVWPPGRPPLLVTAYLTESQASSQVKEATLAQVGMLVRDIAA